MGLHLVSDSQCIGSLYHIYWGFCCRLCGWSLSTSTKLESGLIFRTTTLFQLRLNIWMELMQEKCIIASFKCFSRRYYLIGLLLLIDCCWTNEISVDDCQFNLLINFLEVSMIYFDYVVGEKKLYIYFHISVSQLTNAFNWLELVN